MCIRDRCRHSLESASSQSEVTRIAPEACTQLEGHLPTGRSVVTECLILRPRAMQVINCAAWHGQQRRQAVARRDSMAASTPNSHENKIQVKNRQKNPKKSAPAAGHGTPSPPRMDTLWGPRAGPEFTLCLKAGGKGSLGRWVPRATQKPVDGMPEVRLDSRKS